MAKTKNVDEKNKKKSLHFQLDHSAKFYPVYASKKAQSVFSVGAEMNENVDKDTLEQAVNEIINRFPSFKVKLKKGFAWHYLAENTEHILVFDLNSIVAKAIDINETNGYQFKIMCGEKRIEMLIFHALTDGNGAMLFLQSIIRRYQEIKGIVFDETLEIIHKDSVMDESETEDSFLKYYKPISLGDVDLKTMAGCKPHKVEGTLNEDDEYIVSDHLADAKALVAGAKSKGVSVTAFVAGYIAYSIERISQSKHPIVMMIPVNLRSLFPSKTMRNFVTFIRVIIQPKQCTTIDEYLQETQKQLKEKATKNKMEEVISTTVRAQGNFLMKILPLGVKRFFIKIGRLFMKSRQTIIFSNLGRIVVPNELGVDYFYFHMNVSKNNPQNVGLLTMGDRAIFAFTRAIKETTLIDELFNNFKVEGIDVKNI